MDGQKDKIDRLKGHAKRLMRGSEKMLQAAEQMEREVADNPEGSERYLSDKFSWSYANFATENLSAAAARIESVGDGSNVVDLTSRLRHVADLTEARGKL